ncbi:hypothetical protein [Myxococcus qinghaiensis]|uniref:hypothetical protein n=1 Tax=Myxococcus qinghaiensis TaxID=2906758 RepID=UPI0020A7AF93|nr:hypothetical protein [Myxococcus qinghaiensis]MCP3166495.1 hypothetical protein [Myxococcus qinghaiensis]
MALVSAACTSPASRGSLAEDRPMLFQEGASSLAKGRPMLFEEGATSLVERGAMLFVEGVTSLAERGAMLVVERASSSDEDIPERLLDAARSRGDAAHSSGARLTDALTSEARGELGVTGMGEDETDLGEVSAGAREAPTDPGRTSGESSPEAAWPCEAGARVSSTEGP